MVIRLPSISKDTTGINSFLCKGSAVNATGVNGYEFAVNALSTLSVKGDASTSTQMLQIAAYDGEDWSDWTNFTLTTTAPNNLPTVSDPAITIKLPNFLQGRREWF